MVFNIPSWNINNIFSLNIPLMFLLCFFFLILFISPCFFFVFSNLFVFLNLIHFYLIYYQDSIIKQSILHTVKIAKTAIKVENLNLHMSISVKEGGCMSVRDSLIFFLYWYKVPCESNQLISKSSSKSRRYWVFLHLV